MATRDQIVTVWLKAFGQSENRLAKSVRAFFESQIGRITPGLQDAGMVPSSVGQVFNVSGETERFLVAIRAAQVDILETGALLGLNDLDPATQQAIRQHLAIVESQPYWAAIQELTEARIISVIESGLEQSHGSEQIARSIREQMGGNFARHRARRIARTEVGGSLNAGHMISMETLESEGVQIRKEWLTVGDSDVREEHIAMNGQQTNPSGDFNVAGEFAPFPSHYSLSAANRINCRCTVLSVF